MVVLFGLLGLGLVVLIHEAGHFFAARAVGIEVEVFSIGWGKKLVGFKRGSTEYRISMFPLGGFAKMKGDTAYRRALEEGLSEIQPEEHSFFAASPLQRIFVAAAGPAMNFFFAIIVLSLISLFGFTYASYSNRIVLVDDFPEYYALLDGPTPASRFGLQTGDYILALNGMEIENFVTLQRAVAPRALETVTLDILRNGETMTLDVDLALNDESGAGILGIFPYVEPVIAAPLQAAADARASTATPAPGADGKGLSGSSLQAGDTILAVNGKEVLHSHDIQAALSGVSVAREQASVNLTILRNGDEITVTEPLFYDDESESYFLGYSYRSESYRRVSSGFFRAIADGVSETFETLRTTVKGLSLLFRGLKPGAALSGPIRITVLVGEITTQGLSIGLAEGIRSFFHLLSLLSVALFFGNLLPIPVLDGGQILISIAEMIKRSPISPKTFFRYQTFGGVIIFALLVFILFSDLLFIFGGR